MKRSEWLLKPNNNFMRRTNMRKISREGMNAVIISLAVGFTSALGLTILILLANDFY